MTAVAVLTPEQLAELVRTAVAAELDERAADAKPQLLDRNGIAAALDCSPAQVDRLRRQGLPTVFLGGASPRFILADCLEWLRRQPGGEHD